jgi:hypothetical protein
MRPRKSDRQVSGIRIGTLGWLGIEALASCIWQSLTTQPASDRDEAVSKSSTKNLPVYFLWKSDGGYRIEQCWTSCSKTVSQLNFLNAYHLLLLAADCCPYFEPKICHNFRQRLMMHRATRARIQVMWSCADHDGYTLTKLSWLCSSLPLPCC